MKGGGRRGAGGDAELRGSWMGRGFAFVGFAASLELIEVGIEGSTAEVMVQNDLKRMKRPS